LRKIAVIDYGAGNLRSVARALDALGADYIVTNKSEVVESADALILPGQGAFKECIEHLEKGGLDAAIKNSVAGGKPYLGICLGLQVLFDTSEEFGITRGLGLLPGRVVRFSGPAFDGTPPQCKIPHMGWTRLRLAGRHPIFDGIGQDTYFYFVHSFYVCPEIPADIAAMADHGGVFAAAAARGNIMGVQFHPEKSQEAGRRLLQNFLRIVSGELKCS
jgi:imidazole glycerol-phosphate synthase subunit HisH